MGTSHVFLAQLRAATSELLVVLLNGKEKKRTEDREKASWVMWCLALRKVFPADRPSTVSQIISNAENFLRGAHLHQKWRHASTDFFLRFHLTPDEADSEHNVFFKCWSRFRRVPLTFTSLRRKYNTPAGMLLPGIGLDCSCPGERRMSPVSPSCIDRSQANTPSRML